MKQRKWKTFTPNQQAVLWLMREYGVSQFRDGFRRMNWAVKQDGSVVIDGPSFIYTALMARDLIEACDGVFRLTESGHVAASAYRKAPAQVDKTRLQLEPFWLTSEQVHEVSAWFPKSHGKPRRDDRAILSGIVMVLRENLMWGQAPAIYGGELALRRRYTQWGQSGVLNEVFAHLFEKTGGHLRLLISPEILARHSSGRMGVARGWFESIISPEELEQAA